MHPVTRRIIDGTPARLRPGVELTIRTVDDSFNDRVPGLAAEIAAAHLGNAQHMPFAVPMTGDGAAKAAYDAAAAAIGDHLAAGRHVALLCEGDPMVYGSAASVMARLGDVRPEIVPGVVAATAAAASAGVSLVRGADSLTLLPATKSPAALATALRAPGAHSQSSRARAMRATPSSKGPRCA